MVRTSRIAFSLALAVACACGGKREQPKPKAEEAAVEPSVAAEREQHPDRTVWTHAWREASALGTRRAGIAVAESGRFIYVMGGVLGDEFLATTEYAQVQTDGSLGPWKPGPAMNEPRGFFAAVVHGGYVYVVGGGQGEHGEHLLRSAERAKINPDGSLGAWAREHNEMNMPRRCSKAVVVGDAIYAIGGFGGDMLSSVEHAVIQPDGTLGEWLEEGERLTTYRYISGVKKVGDYTYVAGGHDQVLGVGTTGVERSKVVDQAGFAPWKVSASPLEVDRYGLDLAVHGDQLFALGGITGTEYLDSVEVTRVRPDGELEPWRTAKIRLAEPLAMFGTAVCGDWIYVIGGTQTAGSRNKVWYASVNEAGELGSWATPAEQAQVEEYLKTRARQRKTLTHQGVVVATMPAARYLYIQVETKERGREWLAAPSTDVEVGDVIRYGDGVPMQEFYSKELKRQFELVIFVGEVQKAAPATE